MLLWGLREGRRRPSADHPLGYGKAIYFWSFIVALMLFSRAGMGSRSTRQPQVEARRNRSQQRLGGDGRSSLRIAAERRLALGMPARGQQGPRQAGLWRWFRTSRQSELLVVLAEDVAALGGLVMALAFIGMAVATGNPVWDAAGSIAIGALLVLVAVLVGVEIKALLIGQGVEDRTLARMRSHLADRPEVERVYNLITQQMGRDVMVAVKARLAPAPSAVALVEAINRVEQGFRAAFPEVRWLFFEPDLVD